MWRIFVDARRVMRTISIVWNVSMSICSKPHGELIQTDESLLGLSQRRGTSSCESIVLNENANAHLAVRGRRERVF